VGGARRRRGTTARDGRTNAEEGARALEGIN